MESNLKPTILHFTTSLDTGGTERQMLLILPRLTAFNHVVICLKQWGEIGNQLRSLGFSVYFVPTSHLFSINAIAQCKKIIQHHKPKLMITYLPFADFFGRLWRNYLSISTLICFLRSTMREWRYFPLVFLNIASQWFVDYFFTVSNTVKRSYERLGLQKGKTDVIYNGIIIERADQDLPKAPLEVPNGIPLLGYVARLRKERGHKLLFQTMACLKARGVRVHLWLVGDGNYQSTLEHQVRTLGIEEYVSFLGYQKNISAILHLFTLYVHPSQYEGMSNALLEAMVAGCPIITTNIPENRELIQSNIHGILVPTKHPEAMADAIQFALKNQKEMLRLGDNARQRAKETFNIDRTVTQLTQLLQKYVDGK